MSPYVRRFGNSSGPPVVFVAGFGDHGGMFEALADTAIGERFMLLAVDLPGSGFSAPARRRLTLQVAADQVAQVVAHEAARTIVGHSVGSIVASLAALRPGSTIEAVLSIEGNLTLADAYYSGSAADYGSAEAFRTAFLERLDAMSADDPALGRYREQVASADPQSIWELGCDTYAFSQMQQPGEVLIRSAARVRYLFNPENTPAESIAWLARNRLSEVRLDNAGHWKSVDQPDLMAEKLLDAIAS